VAEALAISREGLIFIPSKVLSKVVELALALASY